MSYEQKNNQGSMFVNDKQGKEQRPDWRGSIMVDGKEYWCSAWNKATRDGKKWLSLSVRPKEAREKIAAKESQGASSSRDPQDPGFDNETNFPF